MICKLVINALMSFLVLRPSFAYLYDPRVHHVRMAHFHMEDRSPAIELHATDDGVHVRTNPASLDIASNIPQSHDFSSRYSYNRYGNNRWGGRRGSDSRNGWSKHRPEGDYDNHDRGNRGNTRQQKASYYDDVNQDDGARQEGHAEADKKEINKQNKAMKVINGSKRPDMSVIAPLRPHLEEPIKYEGEPYNFDIFAQERGLSGFKKHGVKHELIYRNRKRHRRHHWRRRLSARRENFGRGGSPDMQVDRSPTPYRVHSPASFIGNQYLTQENPSQNDDDNGGFDRFSPPNLIGNVSPLGSLAAGFYEVSANSMLTPSTMDSENIEANSMMPFPGTTRQLNGPERFRSTASMSPQGDRVLPPQGKPIGGFMKFVDLGHAPNGLEQPNYSNSNSRNSYDEEDNDDDDSRNDDEEEENVPDDEEEENGDNAKLRDKDDD